MFEWSSSCIKKVYLGDHIDLETLVILEKIFHFRKKFDKKLDDPVWETVSMKIRKYDPFINIDVFQYKKVLRDVVIMGKFFESDMVREELTDINQLQQEIYSSTMSFPSMSRAINWNTLTN